MAARPTREAPTPMPASAPADSPPPDVDPEVAVEVAVCEKLLALVAERLSGVWVVVRLVEDIDVFALDVGVEVVDDELTLLVKLM